ncbi:MFS transporter [Devosia sp. 2618]|uniref:CynX/NimT family MFS transporter n=1 Tax=Devosia sp. 2618 TaxID=3156454 RepID=UPI0033971DA4
MNKSTTLAVASSASAFLIVLTAANLRPALTTVGPLLEQIRQDAGITLSAAGLLNSLALLALGLFAPLGHFARRFGADRVLFAALLMLVTGLAIRSLGSVAALFGGTLLLGAGIAIGNVLVPSIIKRDFPHRVHGMTSIYAVSLGVTAGIASGLAIPLAGFLPGGWRSALAIWAIPALIAAIAWMPRAFRAVPNHHHAAHAAPVVLWRSSVAWAVTGFMGLQSLLFYVIISWFPTILQGQGFTPAASGWMLTAYQLVALAVSAAVPVIIGRLRNQSLFAALASLAIAVGMLGYLAVPSAIYLWMVLLGLGGGCCLTLALSFIGLRAADHHEAAVLSIMAQSLGYILAATGPFSFGLLHDLSGSWTPSLALLAALAIVQAAVGYYAGRAVTASGR